MNLFKSHFWYNKRQRNGILFLVILIVVLQGVYFFIDFPSDKEIIPDVSEIDLYQQQIDSLKVLQTEKKKVKIFPFNPNYITDFKGYQLGMSVEEIDRLLNYRKTGRYINTNEEFQNITLVNDSLLSKISPFFKFPEWVNSNSKKNKSKSFPNKTINNNTVNIDPDLNKVTFDQLKSINGIGDKLAKRIISYRKSLHGFTFNEQLYEVYYLDKKIANNILKYSRVIQKPNITKVNINEATFKEVLHLPYLDYELTKKIFNYHDENGDYSDLEDLKKIDSFPNNKFERIALYLTVD